MSRQNPNDSSPNPCKRWFKWSGDKGKLKYYDKELGEDVFVDLPFEFILLDRMATIKGWNDASGGGIYSNEIRSTVNEEFTVRGFEIKEPLARGFYADIKDKVKAAGGRFNTNLYIAFEIEQGKGQLEIGSLMLHGASLTPWFEFEKSSGKDLYKSAIRIPKAEDGKKGSIKFKTPVFELTSLVPEMDELAGQLQGKMKEYLGKYLARGHHDPTLAKLEQAKAKDVEEDDIPPF
jgi:hypothetical protein